jgi:rhodanese-related sulfurtransferase
MILSKLFGRGHDSAPSHVVAFDDLRRDLDAGACVLVDVREPGEFRTGHVPGSHNLPLSRFDAASLPKDKKVVLICQSGMRSGTALTQARKSGHPDVAHFAGGVSKWRSHGGAWRGPSR